MIQLRKGDRIVTAWAERTSGPGWSNWPVWVLISNPRESAQYRLECLQPEEYAGSAPLVAMSGVSDAMHRAMVIEVAALLPAELAR